MSWQGGSPTAVAAAQLLEREAELGAIDRAISAGSAGSGGFLIFEGPAGVGKSVLLATACEQAPSCGMRVLHARGCDLERGFAFGVARQLFESLLLRVSPLERDALLAGAGRAGLLVGAPGSPASGTHITTERDDAFEALHGLFWLTANIAATAPLLIAIDDLEGCDAGSLRWLAYLGRRLHGMPVLVVAGAHAGDPGADGALLAEAMADALVLHPGALGPLSTASLVRDALAIDADDDFCATCHAATRGSPLLLNELLEALAVEGIAPVAQERGRALEIGAHRAGGRVRRRLARLPARAGALARAVAVLGDCATLDDAAALAGIGKEAAAAATILGQSGLLRLEFPLTFAFPLEGAAIYQDIVPLEREAGHAHAARRLSAEHAKAERIADHLLRAPSQHESFALEALREAARDALLRGAPTRPSAT